LRTTGIPGIGLSTAREVRQKGYVIRKSSDPSLLRCRTIGRQRDYFSVGFFVAVEAEPGERLSQEVVQSRE